MRYGDLKTFMYLENLCYLPVLTQEDLGLCSSQASCLTSQQCAAVAHRAVLHLLCLNTAPEVGAGPRGFMCHHAAETCC